MNKLKTVALLGRDTGLQLLEEVLIGDSRLDLKHVFTHKYLPKKDGGAIRPEALEYQRLCDKHNINLEFLDGDDAKNPHNFLLDQGMHDLLIVLSWRYILPTETLEKFKIARINIHRGALPAYKGGEPVRRAIENNDKTVTITAHHIIEELDAGSPIGTVSMDIDPCPKNHDAYSYAEIIKIKLKPLYSPLARLAIDAVLADE